MKKLYHGTTFEGMQEIIKGNYNPKSTIWDCSNPGYMYCYEEEALCKSDGMDEDEIKENGEKFCIERANESGQIGNAILHNPYDKTYVIQFTLTNKLYKELIDNEELQVDTSCENMKSFGSMIFDACALNRLIKEGIIKMKVFVFPFCVKLSLMYIASLVDNEYFEETLENLSRTEYDALLALSKTEYYGVFEDLVYVEPIDSYIV